MKLFHQLDENEQQLCIHYCMHLVVEDMLEDGVEIEPFSDEDKKAKSALIEAVTKAKTLPPEEQFEFLVHHKEVGGIIFDISLDMARSAYYHPDDDLVIFPDQLRDPGHNHDHIADDAEEMIETVEELVGGVKKNNQNLN